MTQNSSLQSLENKIYFLGHEAAIDMCRHIDTFNCDDFITRCYANMILDSGRKVKNDLISIKLGKTITNFKVFPNQISYLEVIKLLSDRAFIESAAHILKDNDGYERKATVVYGYAFNKDEAAINDIVAQNQESLQESLGVTFEVISFKTMIARRYKELSNDPYFLFSTIEAYNNLKEHLYSMPWIG